MRNNKEQPIIKTYTLKEFKAGFIPYEHEEQVAFCEYVNTAYPWLKYYAVPNGARTSISTAKKLKAEGMQSGVPDWVCPYPRGPFHGFYLEMKRTKGSETSKTQTEWIEHLRGIGYCAGVALGADKAREYLDRYLKLGPFKQAKNLSEYAFAF